MARTPLGTMASKYGHRSGDISSFHGAAQRVSCPNRPFGRWADVGQRKTTDRLKNSRYESTKKGSPNYHILEGKIIGFWPPGEGSHAQRWKCKCDKKFAVARIEWDRVFHDHEEFCEPMALALRPKLCAGGDKHLAWQLFRPEFVESGGHIVQAHAWVRIRDPVPALLAD